MPPKGKRYMECPTCYTLTAFLNGVCPECGGTGVVEEKEPTQEFIPQGKPEPKLFLKHH
jgi:hypothetical protein